MSVEPSSSNSAAPVLSDGDERDVAMLRELAEITMALAASLGRLALDKAALGEAKEAGDLSLAVTKVGRAVRQTIHFRRKIEGEVQAGAEKRAAAQAEAGDEQALTSARADRVHSIRRKKMIQHAVEHVLERLEDRDSFEELHERLGEYENFTDFTDRPVSAFVADICNAMGLEFDWSQFAYDPWAVQEAETQAEGSPFAEWWKSAMDKHGSSDDPGDDPPGPQVHSGTGPPLAAE
jgi:hypothetical protein